MKRIIFFCLFFQTAALAHATSSDWQLWIVPASRTIDVGDSLKFVYGVTGGGYLNPHDLKVTIYSDADSMLRKEGEKAEQYDTYAVLLNEKTPKDVFQKLNPEVGPEANQKLLLEAEQKTPFMPIYVRPKSPGDKKVKIVLSYKDNEDKWHTISDEFSYHARSFTEQYQTHGFILAILAALVGIWKDVLRNAFSSLRKSKAEK